MSDSRETAFAVSRASFIFQGPCRVFKSSTGSNIAIRMHKQTDNFTHKETKMTIKRKEVSNDQELVHQNHFSPLKPKCKQTKLQIRADITQRKKRLTE